MAIGWFAAFKAIPWGDALAVAPTAVQGAKKLWNSVRPTASNASAAAAPTSDKLSSQADVLTAIESRLLSLESRTVEIANEAVASSEVVKSLAEQNSQLVQAVEVLRVQTRVLLWLFCALAAVTLGLCLWLALRG